MLTKCLLCWQSVIPLQNNPAQKLLRLSQRSSYQNFKKSQQDRAPNIMITVMSKLKCYTINIQYKTSIQWEELTCAYKYWLNNSTPFWCQTCHSNISFAINGQFSRLENGDFYTVPWARHACMQIPQHRNVKHNISLTPCAVWIQSVWENSQETTELKTLNIYFSMGDMYITFKTSLAGTYCAWGVFVLIQQIIGLLVDISVNAQLSSFSHWQIIWSRNESKLRFSLVLLIS